jgi:hypothetical protein
VFYLALLMLIKALAVPVICLEYEINKAAITASLCENKDKPAMHCNGKCHLRKQLAKATETNDPQSQRAGSFTATIDFCEAIELYTFSYPSSATPSFTTWQITSCPAGYTGNIFHPPIIVG